MNNSRSPLLSLGLCSFCFVMTLCFASANRCHAQRLDQLRSERDVPIQYAPNDPLTRGRLFNLQTGHAGAFYTCSGEESKRCSPFIRWHSSPQKRHHGTFEDVLQWGRDRAEIAQRICDGAGACCSGSGDCKSCQKALPVEASAPCGCQSCLAAGESSAAKRITVATPTADQEHAGLLVKQEPQPKTQANASASLLDRIHSARRSYQ